MDNPAMPLQSSVVATIFASIPPNPTTGQMIRVLNDLYYIAHNQGAAAELHRATLQLKAALSQSVPA